MKKFFCLLALFVLVLSSGSAADPQPATPFHPDAKGFVHDWLLGGPFPSYWVDSLPQGFNEDFLVKLGGEANASPWLDLKDEAVFKADWGKLVAGVGSVNEWGWRETRKLPVTWRHLYSDKSSILLNKMFLPVDDHIVSYAFCYIDAPAAMKVKFRVGSDDDHKLYLNGTLLGQANSSQGIVPDNFIYPADLVPGLNRVMLKIVDRTGDYGFCLAVSDDNDKPLPQLDLYIAHPGRNLLQDRNGLTGVDAWNRGFYAAFDFGMKNLFTGPATLKFQVGTPLPGNFKLQLALLNGSRNILAKEYSLQANPAQPMSWSLPVNLPAGALTVRVTVTDPTGKTLAVLEKSQLVYDLNKIKADLIKLQHELERQTAEDFPSVRKTTAELRQRLAAAQRRRTELYAQIENKYAAQRAQLKSQPAPVDAAMSPNATPRLTTCLNGDLWQVAKVTGSEPPQPGPAWRPCTLPTTCYNPYFRSWRLPIQLLDAKNPYGNYKPAPGWDDYKLNDLLYAQTPLWFRREFTIDASTPDLAYAFVSENICGRLQVYVNGNFCGEHRGDVGLISIPLPGLKPGLNRLDLRIAEDPATMLLPPFGWGPRGDLYLQQTAAVHVADIEVKTSWRQARLDVSAVIKNTASTPARIRLEQYCVLNDRIKYRLPALSGTVAPKHSAAFTNSGIWLEAEPWGIGGQYGNPTLYRMVSDLYVNDQLVDRRMDRFGFREFWIAGTDFFLNGKRIILQGDVGQQDLEQRKSNAVLFSLLRADGINIVRNHDGAYYSPEFLRSCDELGMLAYVQSYPVLHDRAVTDAMKTNGSKLVIPYDAWLKHPLHQFNLENYARWTRMLRNHPSVVIAATDNEIFTQAWDHLSQEDFNIRNDRLGAFYEKYVKSLNPALVMTRDGDEGTWGWGKWTENPPCDTANYHYPDYNINETVKNWQTLYKFRPAVFGETLYCTYFEGGRWVGPTPDRVAKKAAQIRNVAAIYRQLEIPCSIYMGPGPDGFALLDNSGKGNPWGITLSMLDDFNRTGTIPKPVSRYPWAKIAWPSLSGPGIKPPAASIKIDYNGTNMINWFDPAAPTHIRNAVNNAYRDTLLPQPQLARTETAECLIELDPALAGAVVIARSADGLSEPVSVMADSRGTAWLQLPRPGKYVLECGKINRIVDIPAPTAYATRPGFGEIPRYKLNAN